MLEQVLPSAVVRTWPVTFPESVLVRHDDAGRLANVSIPAIPLFILYTSVESPSIKSGAKLRVRWLDLTEIFRDNFKNLLPCKSITIKLTDISLLANPDDLRDIVIVLATVCFV